MLGTAVSRGIKIELCYGQAILSSDSTAKRNVISNATQLIRVTRGRGLIFSSEAKTVLGLRAPGDVMNLASVWGLGMERGKDALTKEPRSVVEFARLKRQSYKGIIDVVYGGEKPPAQEKATNGKAQKGQKGQKRKAQESLESTPAHSGEEKISKRQMKKNQKAKQEAELQSGQPSA